MPEQDNRKPRSIIELTYRRMVDDISAGKYKPGERVPGDRELSKVYGIGRSSMIRVLEKLQKDRYVERVPVYGTFVRDDLSSRCQIVSIAFVTPDKSLSPERIGLSNWSAMMEILRGVFEECSARPGVRSTILYCEDTADRGKLRTQLEDLRRFDGVIFCGCLMSELKKQYAAEGKPAVVVAAKPKEVPELYPMVFLESESCFVDMIPYIVEKAGKKPIMLLHWDVGRGGTGHFRNELRNIVGELERNGVEYEDFFIEKEVENSSAAEEVLGELFRDGSRLDGKAVWCLNRLMLPVMNYLVLKYRSDTLLFGGPSSFAHSMICPPVPFLLEPFYEMGRSAVSLIADNLGSGEPMKNTMLRPSVYCGLERIG